MKHLLVFIFLFLIGFASFCQPPGIKSKEDFKVIKDTLYAQYDTVKVRMLVVKAGVKDNYLTRVYGYVINKTYQGKIFKDNPIPFFFTTEWEAIKPEEIESVNPYNWQK